MYLHNRFCPIYCNGHLPPWSGHQRNLFHPNLKKNQISGARLAAAILPLAPIPEPIETACAAGELGKHHGVNVAVLVGVPAHKAGAPLQLGVTACAPLCGLAGIRKVTSRCSPQMQPWQKRVAGVRHPAKSAQPKVAGEPGGRKMCRIKAGGRFGAPLPLTPPRRAGRGCSVGGRNFYFLLGRVVENRKVREEIPWFQHPTR